MVDVVFWISALVAEMVGTMAGFGSSTIFLPIALFFFEFRTALILVAIFHMSGNVGRITFFRHGLDRGMLLTFGLPSIVFTLLGAFLVNFVSQPLLKLVLGVFLLMYVMISFLRPNLSVKASTRNSVLGGSLSGFFAGLIGTGGALRGAFLSSFRLEKSVYVATAAAISLAVDITRIPVYLGSGFLPSEYYGAIPFLFLTAIVGSFLGRRIVGRIPQEYFRKFVLACIGLVALKFLYDGLAIVFD
jgi:uncharacterized membrane protein YfcA